MSDAKGFPNMAGQADVDDELAMELRAAGIPVVALPETLRSAGEVATVVIGDMHKWAFKRGWRYWIATGPGLPPLYADALHVLHGQEARVAGHCACPSPFEWHKGFGVGLYHVDTPRALAALSSALKTCAADARVRNAVPSQTVRP